MTRAADSAASEGNARTRRKAGAVKRKAAVAEPPTAPKLEAKSRE